MFGSPDLESSCFILNPPRLTEIYLKSLQLSLREIFSPGKQLLREDQLENSTLTRQFITVEAG